MTKSSIKQNLTRLNNLLKEKFDMQKAQYFFGKLKEDYNIRFTTSGYKEFYRIKTEEANIKKRKYILYNDFKKAAKFRKKEKYFIEKLQECSQNENLLKYEFLYDKGYFVFCYNKSNELTENIKKIILGLL